MNSWPLKSTPGIQIIPFLIRLVPTRTSPQKTSAALQEPQVPEHRVQLPCSVFEGSKASNAAQMVQEHNWGLFIFFLASHSGRSIQELWRAVRSCWGLLCFGNTWKEAAAKPWKQERKTGEAAEDGGMGVLEWGARSAHAGQDSEPLPAGRKLQITSVCFCSCSLCKPQPRAGHSEIKAAPAPSWQPQSCCPNQRFHH